jgi:hypothetical protein
MNMDYVLRPDFYLHLHTYLISRSDGPIERRYQIESSKNRGEKKL